MNFREKVNNPIKRIYKSLSQCYQAVDSQLVILTVKVSVSDQGKVYIELKKLLKNQELKKSQFTLHLQRKKCKGCWAGRSFQHHVAADLYYMPQISTD